jgi:hypothetical protein
LSDRIDDQNWWREHYMPNYPCGYRSGLSRLMTDKMECGGVVRDHRFSREEVAMGRGQGGGDNGMTTHTMERLIAERFCIKEVSK